MQFRLILAALRKHRLATVLIAMEIALACAVLCNAGFLIAQRLELTRVNSGVDEASLAVLQVGGFDPVQSGDLNARMLAGLRAIPGMQSVSVVNTVPFGIAYGNTGVTLDAAGKHFGGVVGLYLDGPGSFEALGLTLVAGRAPTAEDFQPMDSFAPKDSQVVVSRTLADHLWPGASPLGKEFWSGSLHFRVIGVVAHMARPGAGEGGSGTIEWSVFVPTLPGDSLAGTYLLRADPGDLPRVLRDAKAAVPKIAPDVVLDHDASRRVSDLRERYFRSDRVMAGMMVGVIAALLGVTALGIVGLASFWVAQRRKQIGIRRAIGATRGDILRYFQIENFLIVGFGIALGMVLAFGLNLILMTQYELPRLPFGYLPIGAAVLWALGQLAVLAPALRAANVPPVVATRSV
ncbi:MAG TPA: FtsX-like permease family protein [Rhodanobacteraceae bacterium]|nr:FtsX-like permease family protein [Rhodanobacteraceae bacterium]